MAVTHHVCCSKRAESGAAPPQDPFEHANLLTAPIFSADPVTDHKPVRRFSEMVATPRHNHTLITS